jgi:hypothetical protein
MTKPKWVIMVYIAADDTLANFAIESLKQLKETATDEVVVAAQFDPDGLSNEHQVRRYVFDKTTRDKPLLDDNKFWGGDDHRSLDMTLPDTLTKFMNWVYSDYPADNYCLILWGHGPELLFELPARFSSGSATYFTPVKLKEALENTDPTEKGKLQIIAIDACSMSMCEIAYELKDEAKFLVASQEEVPDLSFPYHTLVDRFSKDLDVRKLCQDGVVGYVKAYQEYFYNESTGMHPVTLAAIDLKRMNALKEPLHKFAAELLSKASDPAVAKTIHSARGKSQGYVGGLYVDLHDFCDQLHDLAASKKLKDMCDNVSKAIDGTVAARAEAVDGHVVEVVNGAIAASARVGDGRMEHVDGRAVKSGNPKLLSHGLSIYFPYLKDGKEKKYIEEDLVKGIPRMIDKDSEMLASFQALNALSIRIRHDVRRQMIKDIEEYYQKTGFDFATDTNWYRFIQQGWSRILAQEEPDYIDTRYLAQQCVKNLLKVIQGSDKSNVAAA